MYDLPRSSFNDKKGQRQHTIPQNKSIFNVRLQFKQPTDYKKITYH